MIEGFNRLAMQSGIDIMRIFDALNDLNNMRSTIEYVKASGGIADCAVCYTSDPKFSYMDRVKGYITGKKIPEPVFTIDYFVEKAKVLEDMGADIISIKDMAGLIPPWDAGKIIRRLKDEVNVQIDLHTHCTPGYGLASVLKAIINHVDIVDTVIMNFAGGPAAPAFELIQIFADKLNIDTGVNLEAVVKINKELREIRKELSQFDEMKVFPIEFDITKDKLPPEIDKLFDDAIKFAKIDEDEKLLEVTQGIDKYFNFPPADEIVKEAQIPGGMYSNMVSQLKQANLSHQFNRVLSIIPKVRLDSGFHRLLPLQARLSVCRQYIVLWMKQKEKSSTQTRQHSS